MKVNVTRQDLTEADQNVALGAVQFRHLKPDIQDVVNYVAAHTNEQVFAEFVEGEARQTIAAKYQCSECQRRVYFLSVTPLATKRSVCIRCGAKKETQ